jgi:hypothetical protein
LHHEKAIFSLAGAVAIGAVLPAHAGPDWQLLEQTQRLRHAEQDAREKAAAESHATSNE